MQSFQRMMETRSSITCMHNLSFQVDNYCKHFQDLRKVYREMHLNCRIQFLSLTPSNCQYISSFYIKTLCKYINTFFCTIEFGILEYYLQC